VDINRLDQSKVQFAVKDIDYDNSLLYKCFYWYGSDFAVDISKEHNQSVVTLVKLQGTIDDPQLAALASKIKNDLIDYRTRQIVDIETAAIKNILIAKAFSSLDIYDEVPSEKLTEH
jgi:His-Xaa-Ser system protein HxsD